MTLDPLLAAPAIIQIHVAAAILALALGPVALWRRSRDLVHRLAGYAWVLAMAGLSLSSFWIHGFAVIGPFGPIHLLSLLVLWSLWSGIRHARAGRIAAHRDTMRSLYWFALGISGALTLLPRRRLNQVLFPDAPWIGIVAVLVIGAGLAALALRDRRRAQLSDRATFMSRTW